MDYGIFVVCGEDMLCVSKVPEVQLKINAAEDIKKASLLWVKIPKLRYNLNNHLWFSAVNVHGRSRDYTNVYIYI